jgi:hypothetical protein
MLLWLAICIGILSIGLTEVDAMKGLKYKQGRATATRGNRGSNVEGNRGRSELFF